MGGETKNFSKEKAKANKKQTNKKQNHTRRLRINSDEGSIDRDRTNVIHRYVGRHFAFALALCRRGRTEAKLDQIFAFTQALDSFARQRHLMAATCLRRVVQQINAVDRDRNVAHTRHWRAQRVLERTLRQLFAVDHELVRTLRLVLAVVAFAEREARPDIGVD